MMKLISRLVFWISGWKLDNNMPSGIDRCVMIAAPHTSNWDLVYARAAFFLMDIPLRFTIKKEWTTGLMGGLIKTMGGIGIDRSPKQPGMPRPSMTEAMTELFSQHQKLAMMVTPEGTRSLRTEWKTGFYFVALNAGVPIALGYLDYKKKVAGVGKVIYPSGNLEADLRQIMAFYKNITPKHQKLFSLDQRYI